MKSRTPFLTAILLATTATAALAEEAPAPSPPGLPPGIDWKFHLDATFGAFGFANSLYTNPKPDEPSGDLSDNWLEGSLKAGLSGTYTLGNSSQLYGKASAVGERTFSAPPSLVGDDANSYGIDDLYIGWRSGNVLGLGENALDVKIGRVPYNLGHGMLLWDGAAEGGSRGGYWTNARKAFEFGAVGTLKAGRNTFEAFYLDKDELPESDSKSKLWGVNYELALDEFTTLGATYMSWTADPLQSPQRDGLDVYNFRAFTAPLPNLRALSFEVEYAKEQNGEKLDSTAWNALVGYQLESKWKPKISYRYAIFEGDDPTTAKNEGFDGLFTGFSDWGTWWQGEIGGEYFLSNSNLISHQFRVHATPSESISTGLILYDFQLDHPQSLGPTVTSKDVGQELDWYMDWSVNGNFIVSFVAALANPGKAIEQSSGRTDTFVYGMIFAAYSY